MNLKHNKKYPMTSLFKRYMLSYGLVVIISFSLLGSAFLYQLNSLAIEEKKLTLEDTIRKVSDSTISYINTSGEITAFLAKQALENSYRINLMQLASYSGANIYLTDTNGVIERHTVPGSCMDGDGTTAIPYSVVEATLKNGSYSDVGNLGGFLDKPSFTHGMPVSDQYGNIYNLVFVSIPAEASLRFSQNMMKTFLGFLLLVVSITLVVTYLIVKHTLQPIEAISRFAVNFAHGDFSARIPLPKIRDEIYSLTENLNIMADDLMKSETERRGLIANVSHDLRTPMTTISGFVDGILDGTIKPENQEKYLLIISDEIKRLSRLANDMVELSRFQSGAGDFNITTFDFTEVVRRIIISFEQKIVEKNIDIEMDVPDRLKVSLDRDSIFRVIYNLTDNAVKFTNQGGKISFKVVQNSGKVRFSIHNTGVPLPPEEARNVFERFYKVDKSRSENKHGAGLGLYIAKTIINKHHGNIWAEGLSDGTCFTFEVPVKYEENDI